MRLIAAIILCLCWGTTFSQNTTDTATVTTTTTATDTSAVTATALTAIDTTVTFDTTAVSDTTLTAVADSLVANAVSNDSMVADTSLVDSAKIKTGLHFFVSVGAQFVNFKEGSKFQTLLEAQFNEYMNDYMATYDSLSIMPSKQDFQTVNLAFPIAAGIMWQFNDMHSLGAGAFFLYDNESVILTDKHEGTHNLKYTLQAFPVFAEYRLQVPANFISLKNGDYFSLFLRYYWMLPHTEIYSSWGKATADFDPLGNGFGVFLGYRFWEWQGLSVWGEMGYLDINVSSNSENAVLNSWNLGGISVLIRAMF